MCVHTKPLKPTQNDVAFIEMHLYTKNREDLEHVHKPCTLYTNQTQQQEKLIKLVK